LGFGGWELLQATQIIESQQQGLKFLGGVVAEGLTAAILFKGNKWPLRIKI
jgi:hypothetical protein